MNNPIKLVYDFNHKAGLVDKGYDDFLESSFQIEEALEGFDDLPYLHKQQAPIEDLSNKHARDCSREIIRNSGVFIGTDVDRLDKACDAVVFAIGSMCKLGLNPQQITKALNVVMQANSAKLNCPKDEFGKLTKPDDFDEKYTPEFKLQEILDERTI